MHTMKSLLSRKLVIGITAAAVLGGGAGAVAATQSSGDAGGRRAYINDLAGRLRVTPSTLTSAMKAALDDRIDAAVAAGRLTAAQGDALKQRIADGGGLPLGGGLGGGFGGGFGGARLGARGVLRAGADVAAQYLGISVATLRSDLAAGSSLDRIASTTSGSSSAGLKAALLAAATTRLDQAVASGRITSAQEQTLLGKLSTRIDTLLGRTWNSSSAGARSGTRRHRRGLFRALF